MKVNAIDTGLQIKVSDTGIGINADRLETVFEPFSQADRDTSHRYGGTGLGLTISQMLAGRMGGAITVRSKPGKGSTFTLRLPLMASKVKPIDGHSEPPVDLTPIRGTRVLVVDDNRTNRLLVQKMLQNAPVDVTLAADGETALAAAAAISPDVILMDLQMPRMTGLEAARCLREREAQLGWARVPIIALTANADPDDRAQCLAAGMDGFLSKPLRKASLFRVLLRHGRSLDATLTTVRNKAI